MLKTVYPKMGLMEIPTKDHIVLAIGPQLSKKVKRCVLV